MSETEKKTKGDVLLNAILDVKDEQVRIKNVGEIELKLSRNDEESEDNRIVFSVQISGKDHIIARRPTKDTDIARSAFKECVQGIASGTKIINLDGTGRKTISAEVVDKSKKSK